MAARITLDRRIRGLELPPAVTTAAGIHPSDEDTSMNRDPWPIGKTPWPNLRKSKIPSDIVKTFRHLDHGVIYAVGSLRGIPIRVGRSIDPRETWTRFQRASDVPLFVHSLLWVPALLAPGIIDSAVQGMAAHKIGDTPMTFDVDVASFEGLIVQAAHRRGVQVVDHVRFITDLETSAVRHRDEKQSKLDAEALRRAQRREISI